MADTDETPFSPEEEEKLWAELDHCVAARCDTHQSVDDALRHWLALTTRLRDRLPDSQEEVFVCAQMLLDSRTFKDNTDYCRMQVIHSLLQEDQAGPLHTIISLLLLDGHRDESTFPRMIAKACFPRLLELIGSRCREEDPRLHRFLLQLMYEMSRIERLKVQDLALVDDDFIKRLLQTIEGASHDLDDPYHYPTIRVLLVLNEQYMLASTDSITNPGSAAEPLTNRIVKTLSLHGPDFRTFGENIIIILNRETETSLQLLILKLLYLLFTTKATYEYFYTNDLRVLVDVIIRNLMDLPDEKMALRHTYLRILYPLLAHTPLNQAPHYKKNEVLRLIWVLRGSQNAHFAPADETTLRLVDRIAKVPWLEEEDEEGDEEERGKEEGGKEKEDQGAEEEDGDRALTRGDSHEEALRQTALAQKLLGLCLSASDTASTISVDNVAVVREKPGVKTPSRHHPHASGDEALCRTDSFAEEAHKGSGGARQAKKPVPAVPKHRHGVPFAQAAKLHVNGAAAMKKTPPKAPPPRRRGKLRAAEAASGESLPGVMPE
ncbi:Protein dip1 [Escovopsis weberi]|uniref:Protein dip1 n=1 Tax=Escovopsis weberi TaxID=150374 RepID=A0A0M9VSC6_ESCWE|nr:Protein dip1 [Escovopsis weberi]